MKTSTKTLRAFDGGAITPEGRFELQDGPESTLMFDVVGGECKEYLTLLSLQTCLEFGLITVNKEIVNAIFLGAEQIIAEFSDVFDGLGCAEGEVSLEIDESVPPKLQIPRRVPQKLPPEKKKQLDGMENMGVITKVNECSAWTSNIHIVRRNDKLRFCIDLADLNKALFDVKYQILKLEAKEILPELHQAKKFSCLDAKTRFWNLKLVEDRSNHPFEFTLVTGSTHLPSYLIV